MFTRMEMFFPSHITTSNASEVTLGTESTKYLEFVDNMHIKHVLPG